MTNVIEIRTEDENEARTSLDALCLEGARRMLHSALQAEVADYVERHREARDERGRALVTRNGKAKPRQVTSGTGTMTVEAPRVHDRRDEHRFTSSILPPYMRRTPKIAEVLPVLYLRGLSTGDFQPALTSLLGEEATAGLAPTAFSPCRAACTSGWVSETTSWKSLCASEATQAQLARIRVSERSVPALELEARQTVLEPARGGHLGRTGGGALGVEGGQLRRVARGARHEVPQGR